MTYATEPFHVVKSAADAAAQDARHREVEDALLVDIGMTRADFPHLLGIAAEDEHIVVWCDGPGAWARTPKNLVDIEVGEECGHVVYIFMARDDEFPQPATEEKF